jgi:hypothetical protein
VTPIILRHDILIAGRGRIKRQRFTTRHRPARPGIAAIQFIQIKGKRKNRIERDDFRRDCYLVRGGRITSIRIGIGRLRRLLRRLRIT